MLKIKLFVLVILMTFFNFLSFAQCAMCKAVVEANLDAGDTNGASLPITAMVDQFYKDVQKMGGGRWDTSSLFKRLKVIDVLK